MSSMCLFMCHSILLSRFTFHGKYVHVFSENNVNTIISARETAANYWLGWALDQSHGHRPGAPVNSQYVYDSKYKINAYGALLEVYSGLYGQGDGAQLAAADSGPLDEAYVGGGS